MLFSEWIEYIKKSKYQVSYAAVNLEFLELNKKN